MSLLNTLVDAGLLSPLSTHFARFIARQSNVQENSILVLTAALLSESNLQGNVCIDLSRYASSPMFAVSQPGGLAQEIPHAPELTHWQQLLRANHCVGNAGDVAPLILDGERLYLHRLWQDEQTVYRGIVSRLQPMTDINTVRLREGLARLFPDHVTTQPDWQKIASALAVSRRFAVISGGPGTGKTTTVVKVLALLLEQNPDLRIQLAAPTGKAAARMVESIRAKRSELIIPTQIAALMPDQASTLHRLLGYQGGTRGYRHDRFNPLLLDCLVVDEASMIDLALMQALLDAAPLDARIILLGDRDQLASVDAGNVLGDITGHGQELLYSHAMAHELARLTDTDSQYLPATDNPPVIADSIALLRTSHRFTAHSGIGRLARLVNSGEAEAAWSLLSAEGREASGELVWLQPADNDRNPLAGEALGWALDRYAEYLQCADVNSALLVFAQTRILCAMHDGPLGDREINRLLAERLATRGLLARAARSDEDFHGKPVMITVNDYELELFNGDIGLLWQDANGQLEACFPQLDGEVRRIPARGLPEHVTAWALTVHKSQGSEFDQVLLVLPNDVHSPLLLRELLYTGITRARSRLLMHGAVDVLAVACRTPVQRSSGLAALLGW
ncbi:MAG: exodeoxyribonuclease V subunit alpha [Gammaproteobacteria bacterium]|nr:exodeoxyribonuclease V subunit alpha [Gammaproteobacteria bacterium]